MDFTPLTTLPAADLDDMIENIEALAAGTGLDDNVVTASKLDFVTVGAEFITQQNDNTTTTSSISNTTFATQTGTPSLSLVLTKSSHVTIALIQSVQTNTANLTVVQAQLYNSTSAAALAQGRFVIQQQFASSDISIYYTTPSPLAAGTYTIQARTKTNAGANTYSLNNDGGRSSITAWVYPVGN
jgi:hypothetical protein